MVAKGKGTQKYLQVTKMSPIVLDQECRTAAAHRKCVRDLIWSSLSIEWNSIELGGPAHGIVTITVHKTIRGGEGGQWDGRVHWGGPDVCLL